MSELKVNSVVDAAGGNTVSINGYTPTMSNMAGRNRIINGDMRIDQRNAGASVTVMNPGAYFGTDRWLGFGSVSSKFSMQKSSTAPSGFTNSLVITSLSSYSVGSSEIFTLNQIIEGYNISDLGFGTASAKPITASFWVRSSLTGTFAAFFANSGQSRWYLAPVVINSANTWEYKTITIPGDTGGTWVTDTGQGLYFSISISCGSTYQTAASTGWSGASTMYGITGQQSLVGTNGATFYITGVQLEAGSVATPFERRPYGTELALCQRYYQSLTASGRYYTSDGAWGLQYPFKVTMRTNPTYTDIGGGNNSLPSINQGIISGSTQEAGVQWTGSGAGTFWAYARGATFSAEL